jgi:hypothetical protein
VIAGDRAEERAEQRDGVPRGSIVALVRATSGGGDAPASPWSRAAANP